MCSNTMHKVAPAIEDTLGVPLLHIGDVTAAAVMAAGLRRVGLLGTGFTMEQSFLTDRLASHGVEALVPDAADRVEVHRIIYEELCLGVVRPESRQTCQEVIRRPAQRGVHGIILGCTQLELLLYADDVDLPAFPTTALHVAAAVTAALDAGTA